MPSDREEFEALTALVLERAASPQELARFRELLRARPDFIAIYRRQVLMATLIPGLSAQAEAAGDAAASRGRPTLARRLLRWVPAAAALTALLAGAAVIWKAATPLFSGARGVSRPAAAEVAERAGAPAAAGTASAPAASPAGAGVRTTDGGAPGERSAASGAEPPPPVPVAEARPQATNGIAAAAAAAIPIRPPESEVLAEPAAPACVPVVVWTGRAPSATWSAAGNWAGERASAPSNALVFAGAAQLTNANDVSEGTPFGGLTFAADAGPFAVGGNAIALRGSVVNLSTNAQTIGLDLVLAGQASIRAERPVIVNGTLASGDGACGITKLGASSLCLRRACTYTGPTQVRQGELILDFDVRGAPEADLIASASPLSLAGGSANARLQVNGRKSETSTQSFRATTFGQGRSEILPAANGGGKVEVRLGRLTRSPAALAAFTLASGPLHSAVTVDADTPLDHGILGAWATLGTNWATHAGGKITAFTRSVAVAGAAPAIVSDAASHVVIDGSSSGGVRLANDGVTDIHTLRVAQTNDRMLTIGAGRTLRLGAVGGVWRAVDRGATGCLTLSGGALTAGGAEGAAGELVLNAGGAAESGPSRANVGIDVAADVTDNGTGRVALVKAGAQSVRLGGTNTHSGGTYIEQGRLVAAGPESLGAGAVRVFSDCAGEHGSLMLAGAGTYTNAIYLSGTGAALRYGTLDFSNGALVFGTNDAVVSGVITLQSNARIGTEAGKRGTVAGRITGRAGLEFFATGWPNRGTITISNPSNDWTGDTTLNLNGTSAAARTLRLGASEVIPNGPGKGNVILQNGDNQIGVYLCLALCGHDETINGLSWAGRAENAIYRIVQNGTNRACTLTVGDGDASAAFLGKIENGSSAPLSVRKIGQGRQVFSGPCSYTGATEVAGGILEVSGSLTGGHVAVATNALFAYTGAAPFDRAVAVAGGTFVHASDLAYTGALAYAAGGIGGSNWRGALDGLTIGAGRWIAPGYLGAGRALAGDQAWAAGGAYLFEIADAEESWDTVRLAGTLDLSGLKAPGSFTVRVMTLGASGAAGPVPNFNQKRTYKWTLADFGRLKGTPRPGLFKVDVSGFSNAYNGSFRVSESGQSLVLQYSPASGTLMCLQ